MRPRLLLALPLALVLPLGCQTPPETAAPPARHYRVADGQMRDSQDHVLLFRGINLSGAAKTAPDHLFPLTGADVDRLLRSGVNQVRLLTFWKAITPDPPPAPPDLNYLTAFADQARRLADAGIYVVIDMHQDLWGVPFEPHGAPDWACPPEITEGYAPKSPWWLNYTTPQVQGCFDRFWGDLTLQAELTTAWTAVAQAVCDNDRVVGFDLFNEPYPGSNLFDADWDNHTLLPFYERLMDALEAVCPGRIFFLEPSAAYVLGVALPMELPDRIRDRAVFAGHFYPQSVHEPGTPGYDGDASVLADQALRVFGPYLEAGVPIWNGEWGGITTNPGFALYVRDYQEWLTRVNASSALWDYGSSDGGFAFLDAAGARKPVFDTAFASPALTRLPSPPEVTPEYGARALTARFTCRRHREVTVLLPTAACTCDATPADALDAPLVGPGFSTAACRDTEPMELGCHCEP